MAGTEIIRGDIWLIDLGLAQKVRPAVVLSVPYFDNERALVSYVLRTTSVRGTRFEVPHASQGFAPGAFDAQSLGTIPAAKLLRRISRVDDQTLAEVEIAVRTRLRL